MEPRRKQVDETEFTIKPRKLPRARAAPATRAGSCRPGCSPMRAILSEGPPDVTEVVVAGASLLQRQEQARAAFVASLEAAEAEAERDGWHSLDDVLAEADEIIAAKRDAASAVFGGPAAGVRQDAVHTGD